MKVTTHTVTITSPTDGAQLDVMIEIDPSDCTLEDAVIQTDDIGVQVVGDVTVHRHGGDDVPSDPPIPPLPPVPVGPVDPASGSLKNPPREDGGPTPVDDCDGDGD